MNEICWNLNSRQDNQLKAAREPMKEIDMDTIGFTATAKTFRSETYLEVTTELNGKWIDGGLIDVSAIIFGTAVKQSSFYFFTCSCGVAGCDGYHQPLDHKRTEKIVTWIVEDEKLAEVFGSTKLEFHAAHLDAAVAQLKADVLAAEESGVFSPTMTEIDYASDDCPSIGRTLKEVSDGMVAYYIGQENMAVACEEAADPNNPCEMRFTYGDTEVRQSGEPEVFQFFDMAAVDIAARLLNLGESVRDGDEARIAELKSATNILRDFAKHQDTQVAEDSFSPLRRFLREDGFDEEGIAIFNMDDAGPFVRLPL